MAEDNSYPKLPRNTVNRYGKPRGEYRKASLGLYSLTKMNKVNTTSKPFTQ